MGYHTVLKNSADFTDALKNARKLAWEMLKKTGSHVFPYRLVTSHNGAESSTVNLYGD